jgi:long-subunit fatty acid transport protein
MLATGGSLGQATLASIARFELRSAPLPFSRRRTSRIALVPSALAALAIAGASAHAGPLDDPHVGGVGFAGPTTGDLTAVFWNPAALGLLQGTQLTVAGSAHVSRMTVRRAPIDPATGAPGGARAFPVTTGGATTWPPGPGSFAAFGSAIGNRFTLAIAAYTPFAQRISFTPDAGGELPTRYHMVHADLHSFALMPALAFRVGNEMRIGVAPGFLFTSGRLAFDEDTAFSAGTTPAMCGALPCQAEDPAAAARYDLASGTGLFDATLAYTIAGGLYFRLGPTEVGLAYSSRPLGELVEVNAPRTTVMPPSRLGVASLCPPDRQQTGCSYGNIRYRLPDVFTGGLAWNISTRLTLSAVLRYFTYSLHDRITIRVSGPATGGLRDGGLPERIVLHRGYVDNFETRLRIARLMGSWLRLGAGVRLATSAVPRASMNAASGGGLTVEPAAMFEVRAPSWLRLTAGYALALTPATDTGSSVFDPTAAGRCAEAMGNLESAPCLARVAGTARPTAAGTYSGVHHTASLSASIRF